VGEVFFIPCVLLTMRFCVSLVIVCGSDAVEGRRKRIR
jgi:hypothetical protein